VGRLSKAIYETLHGKSHGGDMLGAKQGFRMTECEILSRLKIELGSVFWNIRNRIVLAESTTEKADLSEELNALWSSIAFVEKRIGEALQECKDAKKAKSVAPT
jgi:hypothetical protein